MSLEPSSPMGRKFYEGVPDSLRRIAVALEKIATNFPHNDTIDDLASDLDSLKREVSRMKHGDDY
jgi:hypothetical protein